MKDVTEEAHTVQSKHFQNMTNVWLNQQERTKATIYQRDEDKKATKYEKKSCEQRLSLCSLQEASQLNKFLTIYLVDKFNSWIFTLHTLLCQCYEDNSARFQMSDTLSVIISKSQFFIKKH